MIIGILKQELSQYNWHLKYEIESDDPFYYVIFPKCKIIFYKNVKYSTIECKLFKDNNMYPLEEILEYNGFNFSELFLNQLSFSEEKIIKQYVNIIHEKLLHIISGDIDSIEKINEHRLNTKRIQKILGKTLVFDSLIYKKMLAGDISWEKDLLAIQLSEEF